jgi:excinuclease ABC subunit B
LDNRPLRYEEFDARIRQVIYVSATPADFEYERAQGRVAEQVIRPTGLMDPEVEVRPARNQVDDLLEEIRRREPAGEAVLVTTLTKRMAEDLTEFYANLGVKVRYMHSDIKTLERMGLIRDLRRGEYQVLIGINLLREGLDIPEVSLVAILDADKEGFLRSERSLIQTCGRAARNVEGKVIMYADQTTEAMASTIAETARRRDLQRQYNEKHGITPSTIRSRIKDIMESVYEQDYVEAPLLAAEPAAAFTSLEDLRRQIGQVEKDMYRAAENLEFEEAARWRDLLMALKEKELQCL